MNKLLAEVIDANGGMDRWNAYQAVTASIISGGGFFALKGLIQDPDPRRMTVWLHEQRSSVLPYGAPDQRTVFTPDRIAIEKVDGTVVAQRFAPTDSFAGHQMQTPWDQLHRAYFNGEALWTYLTTGSACRRSGAPTRAGHIASPSRTCLWSPATSASEVQLKSRGIVRS